MPRIAIFGDSIAWGASDKEFGGWVERLKIYFYNQKRDKNRISIYNRGVSGDTSEDLLKRIETELESLKPNWIIIEIGKNDFLFYSDTKKFAVDKKKFEKNLYRLIEISKKFSNNILFIGIGNIEDSKTNPFNGLTGKECYTEDNSKNYNRVIEKVCKQQNIIFIPMFNILEKEDLHDGLHPNAKGHEKIFKTVLPVVKEVIEKL